MSDDNQNIPSPGKILSGDGSKEQPFFLGPTSYFFSTGLQVVIIERIYGPGEYSADSKQRRYYESPNGPPGNKDLCEHILVKSGKSVWFDLSEVSKYQAAHPNAVEESMKVCGADQEQVDRAKRYMVSAGRGVEEKSTGCFGVLVLMAFIVGIVTYVAVRSIGGD